MTALIVVLLAMGAALLIAEAHVASYGVLGVAGVAALAGGIVLAVGAAGGSLVLSLALATPVVLALTAFGAVIAGKALAAHRDEPVRTGSEELIGAVAEVREPLDPEGQVFVFGALWRARAMGGGEIGPGNRVRVMAVDGLTLEVEPAPDRDPASVEKGA